MLNWVDEDALNSRRKMESVRNYRSICTHKNTLSTTHAHTERDTHSMHVESTYVALKVMGLQIDLPTDNM